MTGKVSFFFSLFIAFVPPLVFLCVYNGGEAGFYDSYITLAADAKQGGKEISDLLAENGIDHISARRQRAFLNDFDGLESVPIDEYFERIEDFDPRNDGYAKKALSIFISGGEERVFVRADSLYAFGGEEKLLNLLKGAGCEAFKKGGGRRVNIPDIVIFILCTFAFVFLAKKSNMPYIQNARKTARFYCVIAFLPSFAALVNYGAAGFALCAVSIAFFQIPRDKILYDKAPLPPPLKVSRRELKILLPLAPLFILIAAAGRLPLAVVLFYLLFFSLAFFACVNMERISRKTPARVHFIAAPILPKKRPVLPFKHPLPPLKCPLLPLPFVFAALLELVIPVFIKGGEIRSFDFKIPRENLVSERDWKAHYEFQKNFSYENLNAGGASVYLHYGTDGDGLISQTESAAPAPDSSAVPPFPLKDLVSFLSSGAR